jgi:FlaA1/EpsC-like NDP-sugar epimerase
MDWAKFLGRPPLTDDPSLAESAVGGRSVLITGAGGSIGSGLAAAVTAGRPRRLVLLDLSESALYESFRRLSATAFAAEVEIVPVTGSVGDSRYIAHLLRQYRPELIFHTAAYKHVPLMEVNPFSAIANNSIGTYRLVLAALQGGVSRLIAVSTDKAVNPLSVMGVSKRIAELAVLSHSTSEMQMNVVRLCNVLGSSGSVAAVFAEQAADGVPMTVTDGEADRYFLSPAEATTAILQAGATEIGGRVFVPQCGDAIPIISLARYIARSFGVADPRLEFVGLRRGDKLHEELLGGDEIVEAELPEGMRVVTSPAPSSREISLLMGKLEAAIESFSRDELMKAVAELSSGFGSLADLRWNAEAARLHSLLTMEGQ